MVRVYTVLYVRSLENVLSMCICLNIYPIKKFKEIFTG